MKRGLVLLLALLLTACGDLPASRQKEPLFLTLAVQKELSEPAQAGVDRFVHKVSELSGGRMTIEVQQSDDVLAALDAGAQLIFASNDQMVRADGNFASFTSPFFFYDYKHLSLTLNSQSFLDIANDRLVSLIDALPIGAFYDGNSAMVSARGVMLDTLDQYREHKIYVGSDEMLEYVLEKLGAETMASRTLEERIEGFNASRYTAIECDTMALDRLRLPANNDIFTVCETFHRARINWMLLSQECRRALDDPQRAVLTEAVAFAIAENDGRVLAQEQSGRERAAQEGGQLVAHNRSEFWEKVDEILRPAARYGTLWDWEQHIELRSLAMRTG